jgi:VWFA-related protein
MNRGFAVFLLCAPLVWGQRSRVSPSVTPAPPPLLLFDAVVTDAQGRPTPGLSAEDFAISQAGQPQKVESLSWFDTRSHTADIRRNIVLIVDDLGLAPERAAAVQNRLHTFVAGELAADDRAAIVRTSSGSGRDQELTTDRGGLAAQIARIQPLGRGLSDAAVAGAVWQCIRWAADGLHAQRSRTAVVLVSEHLGLAFPRAGDSPSDYQRRSMALAAHAGMMVFYTVDPRGPAEPARDSPLGWLVRETGGLSVADLSAVLRDLDGYYVLGFHPSQTSSASTPPVLELHGKPGSVRWRFGFLPRDQPSHTVVPLERAAGLQQAQTGATAANGVRTRVTALFTGFTRDNVTLDCLVHADTRDLTVLHDLKGIHQLSAEVQVAAYGDTGRVTSPPGRTYTLTLDDAGYRKALQQGLVYTTRLALPGPGGYQVRAIVADALADRFGTAMQFVEIPAANSGRLAVSGLLMSAPEAETGELSATRVFGRGATIAFSYGVFNASVDAAKGSRLSVRTRIYATNRLVYEGQPNELDFPSAAVSVRQVTSKVHLDDRISPGEYVLEVEVTDLYAKESASRAAVQYTTFEVRE